MIDNKMELLDKIAELEAKSIYEGLNNPDLRSNPAFLAKVREFLKQNKLQTTPETQGVHKIQKVVEEIPTFDFDGQVS